MTLGYSAGGGGGGYQYIQPDEPANPETGEKWLDTSVGESFVYDGSAWQSTTVTDHGELANVSAGDHFDAGDALAFNAGVLNLVYGDPLAVSGDTLGLDAAAPFTLSSGSLALALGNALAVDGSDNLAVQEGDISHDNLAGVSADDHHTRYSDSEARSAVDGSGVSVDHDNLTGVSSDDHHARYTDSEARSAVDGSNVTVDHSNLSGISAGDHFDAGDALAFSGGLLNLVYGDPFAVSGDTLGLDASAPLTLSNGSLTVALGNALVVDGSDNLAVDESAISHDNLAGVSSSDHHARYTDSEARSAVDGSGVSLDHDNLTGVSAGDHFDAGDALAFNAGVLNLVYADPFAVSGDTLGLDTVAPLTLSNGSLAVMLGDGLGLNTSRLAVQPGDISHDDLAGISESDHFGAGDALAFSGGLLNLVYSDPFAVSGDTLALNTVAPLTLSGDSLAVALGNALVVDGSDNLAVDESDISHDNIGGVSSDDHHSRYTDSEARSAVDGSGVSLDHDNLTGVSVDDHFGAGDALAFSGGLLNLVYGDPFAVSGDTLALNTVAPLTLSGDSLAVALGNALVVDGSDNLAVDESDISHDNLSGVSADDHHSRYTDSEARSAVDGSNVSVDHDNLSGVSSSDHHSRYSDGEARSAVDGANVDITGDADTVDGQHASDLSGGSLGWTETTDSGASFSTSSGGATRTVNISDTYDEMRFDVTHTDGGTGSRLEIAAISGEGTLRYYDHTGQKQQNIPLSEAIDDGDVVKGHFTINTAGKNPFVDDLPVNRTDPPPVDGYAVTDSGLSSIKFKTNWGAASVSFSIYGRNI